MLALKREFRGKGLGRYLVLACLDYFAKNHYQRAMLQTESFRLSAIRLYLKMGFKPVLVTSGQIKVWEEIAKKLALNKLNPQTLPRLKTKEFIIREIKMNAYFEWLALKGVFRELKQTFFNK